MEINSHRRLIVAKNFGCCGVMVAGLLLPLASGAVDQTVVASSFGWKADDATQCLQAAFDSGAKRVVVDRQASEWLIDTVHVRSNLEVVFADGVVVRAKPGTMIRPSDCLFKFHTVSNVVFRGEGKAIVRMNRADYLNDKGTYVHSEHRHLMALHRVTNARIENLTLEESGGDSVYLVRAQNVCLEKLICRGPTRLGVGLAGGDGVRIANCVLEGAKGSLPECGMDIEPSSPRFNIGRIDVENCLFRSNNCSGVAINLSHLYATNATVNVTYRNCKILDNAHCGLWVVCSRGTSAPVKGTLNFMDCEIAGNRNNPLQVTDLESDALKVTFTRCRFDARGMRHVGTPIVLSNGDVKSDLNNLTFDGCALVDAPRGVPSVSFSAMTGGGVLPGGAKGVLDITYADGSKGSFDFASLAKRYPPKPELRQFETGTIAVDRYVPAASGDVAARPQKTAAYRGSFTFLQHVSAPGSYPIRLISKSSRKKSKINVQVEVFDPAGTPHDVFTATEPDATYVLKTTARNTTYRLVVRPNGSAVRLESGTPGQGFVATSRVHWQIGSGQDLYFQAKPNAGDVKAELTMSPREWVSAELYAPDGRMVDSCEKATAGVILRGTRAKVASSEIWRLHITRSVDDFSIRLNAATGGLYAYDPALLLLAK